MHRSVHGRVGDVNYHLQCDPYDVASNDDLSEMERGQNRQETASDRLAVIFSNKSLDPPRQCCIWVLPRRLTYTGATLRCTIDKTLGQCIFQLSVGKLPPSTIT